MMWDRRDGAFTFEGSDGFEIAAYRWIATDEPRAVVQLAHGMGEHALRYIPSLAPLVDAGYAIYASDHRGHGRTQRSPADQGDFGAGGYDRVVDDLARLTHLAKSEHPSAPFIFLGHSMGSMLGQGYLIEHSDLLTGAAFSGTTAIDQVVADPAGGLEAFNAPFEPARTPFDWLSRDAKEVDAYIADPWCGFALDPASMMSLFSQGARLADPAQLARIRKGFPLYVFAGAEDPVTGKGGAWVRTLIERYRAAGLDVEVDIYPDARHEVLNETNRDEVVANFMTWLARTAL